MANPYNFILRTQKGSALTHQELDDNFRYLDYAVQNVSGGTGSTTTIISGGSGTSLSGIPYSIVFINSGGTATTEDQFRYVGDTLKLYGGNGNLILPYLMSGATTPENRQVDFVYEQDERLFINRIGNNTLDVLELPNQFSGMTMAHGNLDGSANQLVLFHLGDFLTRDAKYVILSYTSGDTNQYYSNVLVRHDEVAFLLRNTIMDNERRIILDGSDAITIRARQLSTNDGSQILVGNGGVVLTETNSPLQFLLSVNGISRFTENIFAAESIYLGGTASGSTMRMSWDDNNILFGNNSFISPLSSTQNIVIGDFTLRTPVNATNSVVIGNQNSASASTMTDSVVIGYSTASSGTSISQSVLIGQGVAQMHNGFDNVIIGYHTGLKLDGSGNYGNVLIGANSTTNVSTTFFENTIIGETAAVSLTGGTSNVLIGSDVLYSSTVCGDNVIIGDDACQHSQAIGFQNVVIGEQAAEFLESEGNVIIGYSAGCPHHDAIHSLSGGGFNILIGHDSAHGLVSGQQNIAIGCSTNFTSPTISNSIALGYEATVTSPNQFVIGSSGFTYIDNMYIGSGVETLSPNSNFTLQTTKALSSGGGNGTNFIIKAGGGDGAGTDGYISFETSTNHTNNELHRIDGYGNIFYGGLSINREPINDTDVIIAANSKYYMVSYIGLSTGRTVTIPLASGVTEGRTLVIKDAIGLSNTHNITVLPSGIDTIDLTPQYVINVNKQSITIVSDGISNWELI